MKKINILILSIISACGLFFCSCNDDNTSEKSTICIGCSVLDDDFGYIKDTVFNLPLTKYCGYYVLGEDCALREGWYYDSPGYDFWRTSLLFICNQTDPSVKKQLDNIYNGEPVDVTVTGIARDFHYAIGGDKTLPYKNDSIEVSGFEIYTVKKVDTVNQKSIDMQY
ncbi:MAG: hypothetical protein J6P44_00510 [Bacteroidales bacterium]|nr:hypothetical protein [Bacteroidales bacterium]